MTHPNDWPGQLHRSSGSLAECLITLGAAVIHWGQTRRAPYDRTYAEL